MSNPLTPPVKKTDSLYRRELRRILNDLFARLEHNNDIEIKTDRDKIFEYLADGIVKTHFMRGIKTGPGDKLFGQGFSQG